MPTFHRHQLFKIYEYLQNNLSFHFIFVKKVVQKIFEPIIARNFYNSYLIKVIDHEDWWTNVAM